jgi:hypothetical protein
MIAHYEFDNANALGEKEAVIVPNVPTLINKLSANETNNIREKLNELADAVNPFGPIQYLELRLKFKGTGNTADTLQVGDIVHGFADADTIWNNAIYEGGDVNDRNNYTPLFDQAPEPISIAAPITGANQVFALPAGFTAGSVLKSRSELYKGTEWTQTGTNLTIITSVNAGNTIYIKPA